MGNSSPTRTTLKLTEDDRLLAGFRGAVEHIASRHGLEKREAAEFGDAIERACRSALVSLSAEQTSCTITLDEFRDRVEFSMECSPEREGESACSGADSEVQRGEPARTTKFVQYFHKDRAKT